MAYLSILRLPGVKAIVVTTILARFPAGLNAIGIIFFVQSEQESYAVAGAIVSSISIGNTIGGPLQGRLVDRFGLGPLVLFGFAHALGLAGIIYSTKSGAALPVQIAIGLFAGVALPVATSVLRSRWPFILAGKTELIAPAFAMDSVMVEVVFISGPLIAGATLLFIGAEATLVLSAALAAVGTMLFAFFLGRLPGPEIVKVTHSSVFEVVRARGVLLLTVLSLPLGFYLGSLEIALPAFATEAGSEALGGVLLATLSIGSTIAALTYGLKTRRRSLWRIHMRFTVVMSVAAVPLALMSNPLVAIPFIGIAGIPVAAVIASRNELIRLVAPSGKEAESFAWPLTSMIFGISAGAAAAGILVTQFGWRAPVIAATVAATGAALLILTARPTEALLAEGRGPVEEPAWLP